MLRIAICDDLAQCRIRTENAIRECLKGMDYGLTVYKDGNDFLKDFRQKPFDLVFLDIEMPEIDGITLAHQLRAVSPEVPIIFLTSHLEYALEGYEVRALRYLTKPIDPQKLREVLSYVLRQQQEQRAFWVKTDYAEQKLPIRDILYMEAQNQNILICTAKESYSVRYNLSDYENELAQDGFFRIHRGYLVSLAHIKSIGKGEVTIDNGDILPVSRSKEKALKEALFDHVRKEAF